MFFLASISFVKAVIGNASAGLLFGDDIIRYTHPVWLQNSQRKFFHEWPSHLGQFTAITKNFIEPKMTRRKSARIAGEEEVKNGTEAVVKARSGEWRDWNSQFDQNSIIYLTEIPKSVTTTFIL